MAEYFLTNTQNFAEDNTQSTILARLIASVPDSYDTAVGSFVYDLLASFAVELESVYLDLDAVASQSFPQFATDEYLDAIAETHGLERQVATRATGEVTFTGTVGTLIPIGTIVTTVTPESGSGVPVTFETLSALTLASSTGTVDIQATPESEGAIGNVSATAISRLEDDIAGITAVSNAAATTGGADEEDDEALRVRLLARLAGGRGTGTVADYEAWATSIPGVGRAFVEPTWSGNGTVRVTVLDATDSPVSGAVLQEVTDLIDSLAPIGANVTVVTVTTSLHNVSANISVAPDVTIADITTSAQAAITTYFNSVAPGGKVYAAALAAAVLTVPGVIDCEVASLAATDGGSTGTASTSGTNFVTLNSGRKAVLNTLTLGYL